jgi:beta-aspartyl-peptidase (threonine type)
MVKKTYSLAIHGGAGTIVKAAMNDAREKAHRNALSDALKQGEEILASGGSALAAIEAAVMVMEDCELFNAGKGAVFTHDGLHELDASIMCGKTRDAGAVAMVKGIKNPIRLASMVMKYSPFVFIGGTGAEEFAAKHNLERVPATYFFSDMRYQQLQEARAKKKIQLDHSDKFGTVGAVALDMDGNLAAATSTGGLTNKKYGRIGDSALIGAGTYAANDTCAVSCTGFGEPFIRGVVAYDVAAMMRYGKYSLEEAARKTIFEHQEALGGEGGLIAVDALGNIAMPFNSEGMYRAWVRRGEVPQIRIYKT